MAERGEIIEIERHEVKITGQTKFCSQPMALRNAIWSNTTGASLPG